VSTTTRGIAALAAAAFMAVPGAAAAAGPKPGSPAYVQRDNQNMANAWGRVTGPGGQLRNPNYLPAAAAEGNERGITQLAQLAAQPNHVPLTAGEVFPGWNMGNPLRRGWAGRRGQRVAVSWTNRYGALIRGHVWAPLPGARDPYTHRRIGRRLPGVVITTGSVQGSEGMYEWLAEDLAERGYLVLTYDVQGQGTSETLPHENDQVNALPFCNPFAKPRDGEQFGCPGVPAQQPSNFIKGTRDALTFFLSTPRKRYRNPHAESTNPVNSFNPLWRLFDRRRDRHSVTRGRHTRVAIIGHSLGASAVSYVQGVDRRVETVIALDKLAGKPGSGPTDLPPFKPKVPALGVQSEYGFNVQPYYTSNGSSFAPSPGSPMKRPNPRRELETGFDDWRKAHKDVMVVVPRASTHLEYTDIAFAMPASRYGQDLTSVYIQRWLDRYLRHKPRRRSLRSLLGRHFRYLEPVAVGRWKQVRLSRQPLLSFYYCSGYSLRHKGVRTDLGGVGGCGR
jgi:hypothetical protein